MIFCYMLWMINSGNTHIYYEQTVIYIVGLGVCNFIV